MSALVDARQVAIAFTVMSDAPTAPMDVGVIHGLSKEMYKAGNLFNHAGELLHREVIRRLAIVGGDGSPTGKHAPGVAWIGRKDTLLNLQKTFDIFDLPLDKVLTTDPITNSKEEALAIVHLCEEHEWKSAGSISVAYHGGRMLPYMVAAMKESGYWINYRMLPPPQTDWFMEILGSQGAAMTNCFESAITDAVKIEDHIRKGFAAPFDEVIQYLRHREAIVAAQTLYP